MTTASVALGAVRARLSMRTEVAALVGLGLFVGALAAATWGTWGDLDSDTGYDVIAGARVADGEVPYRDFVYYYGPLSPYLVAVGSLLGGSGLWPAVGLGLVVTVAVIGTTYALARLVVSPLGAFLAAALTAAVAFIPSNYSFVLPHTNAATLGTLFLLCTLLCVWGYASSARSRWAVGAGVCLGFLTLTKPEQALAGLLAVAVWLALRSRAGLPVRHVGALIAAPAVAIAALVYGTLLSAAPPRTILFENLWPRDELAAGGSTLIRARMALTPESIVDVLQYTLPYAAGAILLVLLGRALEQRWRRPLWAATGCAGLLFVAGCLARPDGLRDGIYYAWGWIPLGALLALVVVLVRFRRRRGAWTPRGQLEVVTAVALVALAATTYSSFVVNGWRPTMSVYYVPLAAPLIARLHLVELARRRAAYVLGVAWVSFLVAASTGLTLKDARAESVTVRGPGGALAETPAEGGLYQAALREIASRTAPGEPIFVAPLMTGLYPLSGHDSPLRKISMLPGALPDAGDERAAIAVLERAGVRLIVTDRREWPGYGHTSFGESFDRLLADWIGRNFARVRTLATDGKSPRTLDVWVKRA